MQGLCYSALDIAVIVSSMQLGCRDESRILDRIWEGEKAFLDIPYRANQRKFILDTYHWLQYFYDKPVIDKEFPAIQKDLAYSNRTLQADQLTSDFSDLDLFFKSIRIRILYGYGNDHGHPCLLCGCPFYSVLLCRCGSGLVCRRHPRTLCFYGNGASGVHYLYLGYP